MSLTRRNNGFTLDDVYKLGGAVGMGARSVVFISDEYADVSRHPDAVVLVPKTATTLASWVRDTDIERARNFAAGLAPSQGSLAAEILASSSRAADDDPVHGADPRNGVVGLFAKFKKGAKPEAQPKGINHAGAMVFGFWQTAIHNGVVELSAPLTVAPFNSSSGLFLITKGGRITASGIYRAGLIPGSPIPLESAVVLDLNESTLRGWKVPPDPCMTSAEKLRARQRQRDTRALRVMASCVVSLAVGTSLYLYMSALATDRSNSLNAATVRSADIDAQNKLIRRLRFTEERYPDGESIIAINAIQQLYYATQSLNFDWPNILAPEFTTFEAQSSPPVHELTFRHSQRLNPDGTVLYSWPKGAGTLGRTP